MGRAADRAASRTIVAVKAAATNGAKDARRSRALCTRCVLAVLAGDRRRLAVHAVLAREQLFVPRQDSYTKAVFVRVAAMVRMRAVNAHGDGVFRTSRSDAIDSRRQISATLVWTPSAMGVVRKVCGERRMAVAAVLQRAAPAAAGGDRREHANLARERLRVAPSASHCSGGKLRQSIY